MSHRQFPKYTQFSHMGNSLEFNHLVELSVGCALAEALLDSVVSAQQAMSQQDQTLSI